MRDRSWTTLALQSLGIVLVLTVGVLVSGCSGAKMAPAPASSGPTPTQLSVNPTVVAFGDVTLGSSISQNGALRAIGGSVIVSSASWNGTGFTLGGISFPLTIAAGQSIPFTVTFAPQLIGNSTGSVSFLSNASNSTANEQWSGVGAQSSLHKVDLSWNPSSGTVQGYYIYRSGQTGGPYARLSFLQASTAYTDAAVASGQTYYYVVTALGTNSVESGYSNETVASIP